MIDFEGIIVPMMTPFSRDGDLMEDTLRELVDYLIEGGVHGLFPSSSIGEFSSMSVEERKKVIDIVIDQTNGRVPVIPGAGSSDMTNTIAMLDHIEDLGGDGAVVVTPYYLKPDQRGLYDYFASISEIAEVPIFVYQIPMSTGVELSADTVTALSHQCDNIVGMKDSSGNLVRLFEIRRRAGDDFLLFQGFDTLLLPSLLFGCAGGMVGTANLLPSLTVEIFKLQREGDIEAARRIQMERLCPLFEIGMGHGVFPAGFKEMGRLVGMDLGYTRPPIRHLDEGEKNGLREALRLAGFIGP